MASFLPLAEVQKLSADNDLIDRQTDPRGNFSRGLSAGVDQTQALGYGLLAAGADAVGAHDLAEKGIEGYQDNQYEASLSAGDVMDVNDIQSVDDALSWAAFTLGSQVPTLATVIGSGGAAGAVGNLAGRKVLKKEIAKQAATLVGTGLGEKEAARLAAKVVTRSIAKRSAAAGVYATSAGMATGEIAGDIESKTGQIEGITSLAFGAVSGMAESLPIFHLFGGKGIASDKVRKGILDHIKPAGKFALKQAGIEGMTEGIQTVLNQAAVDYVQGNIDLFTKEDIAELKNSMAAGFLVGGVIGVPGGIAQSASFNKDANTGATLDQLEKSIAQAADDETRKDFMKEVDTLGAKQKEAIITTGRQGIAAGDQAAWVKAQQALSELENRLSDIKNTTRTTSQAQQQNEGAPSNTESGGSTSSGRADSKVESGDAPVQSTSQTGDAAAQGNPAEAPLSDDDLSVEAAELFDLGNPPEKGIDVEAKAAEAPSLSEVSDSAAVSPPEPPKPPVSKQKVLDDAVQHSIPDTADGIRAAMDQLDQQVAKTGSSKMSRARRLALERSWIDLEKQPGDIITGMGTPFRKEKAAASHQKHKKLTETHDVVPIANGFGLRPKSDAKEGELIQAPSEQRQDEANLDEWAELGDLRSKVADEMEQLDEFSNELRKDDLKKDLERLKTLEGKLEGRAFESEVPVDNSSQEAAIEGTAVTIDDKANEAATSPTNERPEPTEAQKEAGNYKLGRTRLHGMDVSIENPKGSMRRGKNAAGKEWATEMKAHYGYVRGSEAIDGDHVDVFLGDRAEDESLPVYIVDQVDPETGKYDEPKVMIGYATQLLAKKGYLANYDKGWKGVGAITPMSIEDFRQWVKSDAAKKPVGKLKEPKSKTKQSSAKPPVNESQVEIPEKKPAKSQEKVNLKTDIPMPDGDAPQESRFDNIINTPDFPKAYAKWNSLAKEELKSFVEYIGLDPSEVIDGSTLSSDGARSAMSAMSDIRQGKASVIPVQPAKPTAKKEESPPGYGANNKFVTADKAAELRERLRKKLNGQVNSGFDPELFSDGAMLAAFHIEAGARSFADYTKAMVGDLGENARPYLKSWYNGARDFPGFDNEGMSTSDEVNTQFEAKETAVEEPATAAPTADQIATARTNAKTIPQFAVNLVDAGFSEWARANQKSGELRKLWKAGTIQGQESAQKADGPSKRQSAKPERSGAKQPDSGTGKAKPGPDADAVAEPAGDSRPDRPVEKRKPVDVQAVGKDGDSAPAGKVSTDVNDKADDAGSEAGRRDESGTGTPTPSVDLPDPTQPKLSDSTPTALLPPDFALDDPASIIGGTPGARFDKNRSALELAQELAADERQATPDEQKILAAYTGWGSFGQELFQGSWTRAMPKDGWKERSEWLRDILGEQAWKSAQRSITNAHYTDPPTVMAMWDMVKRAGFRGGRVLEPAMGVGNFFSMMPKSLRKASSLTGIELDEATGGIAKQLFPNSNVSIKGYQDSQTPDGFYDLVIGNWPFEDTVVADRKYLRDKPLLHDYFFLKALDQTRAGGLVVGITSKGTMDKVDTSIRRRLAEKGELVAAYRLPSGAFKEYAGTSVVTDIVILKKRETPLTQANDTWIQSDMMDTPEGTPVRINQYYLDNPQNVLGTVDYGNTLYRPGMIVNRPKDMQGALNKAIEATPQDVYGADTERLSYLTNQTDERVGALYEQDGALQVSYGEQALPAQDVKKFAVKSDKATAVREADLKGLVGIRRAYQELLTAEQTTEGNPEPLRKALAKAYKAYVNTNGNITNSWGMGYLRAIKDPNRAILQGLEIDDGKGGIRPALVMKQSTMRAPPAMENPSITDAFVLARNQEITPNIEDVAKRANVPVEQARKELIDKGALFEDPTGDLVPSDIYLSGDVRDKYSDALTAVEDGRADLQRNVDALAKVIPPTVPYHEIEAKLGAPWVPLNVYSEFIAHMLNDPNASQFDVRYRAGTWSAKFPTGINGRSTANAGFGVANPAVKFTRIVNAALKNQRPRITYTDKEGTHLDVEATEQMAGAVDKMRDEFNTWVWSDPERRVELEKIYNETRNAVATPSYDGSFLKLPGMALKIGDSDFNLRPHQVNAIWRGIVNKRGMYAHEVGTGKSFTIAGIAVESRRYGIAKKPLVLAHNANSAALAHEINLMYPGARVLYINNLDSKSIDQRLQQIATDDWDAIVMPHSLVNRLAFKKDTLMEMAAEEIESLETELFEALDESDSEIQEFSRSDLDDDDKLTKIRSATAKSLAKQRKNIISNIERQALASSKDGALSFEDLGIDMVLVDEVHEFKKPPIATRMSMKGLNTTSNNKSISLNFMTKYIQSQNGGGNVHTFTGTLITNTLTELYAQMRYTMPQEMIEQGIEHWDGFFGSYMSEVNDIELSAAGEFEQQTRLAAFINLPEMRQLVGQFMDIVFAEDMPAFQPRKTPTGKTMADSSLDEKDRDLLENGRTEGATDRPYKRVITVNSDMTAPQKKMFDELQRRAKAFRNMSPKGRMEVMKKGGDEAPLTVENMAAKASFDMRLVDGEKFVGQEGKVADDPKSKASQVVNNVMEVYNSHKQANQIIFMSRGIATRGKRSLGRNKSGAKVEESFQTFSTMLDIIERLVQQGIPREQIAVIGAGTSAEKKKAIADAMNDSSIRVTLGSIQSMGVGVNMQKNLRAMHHMDAPWMPGDLEQGNGRGHRQGNQWNTVREYRYLTDRLDGRRWQILSIKAKFIKAFMKADGSVRSLEGDAVSNDEGGGDLLSTFAEAAGDPRILLRASLKNKMDKLNRSENLYSHSVAEAKNRARQLSKSIETTDERIEKTKKSLPAVEQWRAKDFTATIDGKTFAKAKDADKAITAFIKANVFRNKGMISAGSVRGAPLSVGYTNDLTPDVSKQVTIGDYVASTDAGTAVMVGLQASAKSLQTGYEKLQSGRQQQQSNLERLQQVSKEPFKQADKLIQVKEQLDRLETDMAHNPVPPPVWLREGAPVGTDVMHNGTRYEVTGHRYTDTGYFVASDTGNQVAELPYMEVTDEQGIKIYEEHEFIAPEIVTADDKKGALNDKDKVPDKDDKADFEVKLSRGAVRKKPAVSLAQANAVIQQIQKRRIKGMPPIEVVRRPIDVPGIPTDMMHDDQLNGIFYKKKVYLFSDAAESVLGLEQTLLHEIQHSKSKAWYTRENMPRMVRLTQMIDRAGGVEKVLKDMDIPSTKYDYEYYDRLFRSRGAEGKQKTALHVDEILSVLAESDAGKFGQLRALARQIIAGIRRWLRENGFMKVAQLPADEMIAILAETRRSRPQSSNTTPTPVKAQRVFHGTPHKFDQFKTDSIGTGEGAQMLYSGGDADISLQRKSRYAEGDLPQNIEALPERPGPQKKIDRSTMVADALNRKEEKRGAEIRDQAIGKLRKFYDGGKRQFLGLLSRRQLIEVMTPYVPRAAVYLRVAEQLDADRNQMQADASDISERWGKLKVETRTALSNLMHAATIGQVDPSVDTYQPLITEEEYKKEMAELSRMSRNELAARGKLGKGGVSELLERKNWITRVWNQEQNRQKNRGEIEKAWKALPKEGKDIYRSVSGHYDMLHNETMGAIEQRLTDSKATARFKREQWDIIRKQFEMQRMAGPYFPLSRFGNYWVSTGKGMDRTVDMFETEGEWKQFITNLQDAGETDLNFGKKIDSLVSELQVPADFVSAVHELIGGESREADAGKYELRDQIHQLYLSRLPEMSVRHHSQHRNYVKGYSNDALRSFSDHSFHSAHNIAKLRYVHTLQDSLIDMKSDVDGSHRISKILDRMELLRDLRENFETETAKEIYDVAVMEKLDKDEKKRLRAMAGLREQYESNDQIDVELERLQLAIDTAEIIAKDPAKRAKAADYVSELSASHARMMAPNVSPVAQALNSLGFVWFLGASPAAAIVNTFQVPMMTLPFLGAKYGMKTASKELNRAYADFFSRDEKGDRTWSVTSKLNQEEKKAFNELVRRGVIEVTRAQDLAGVAQDGQQYTGTTYKIMKTMSWGFHHAERMNREISSIATYRLARSNGASAAEALKEASDMTWKTQYDYGSTNRARFMSGNVSRVFLQFKQYSAATTYLYVDVFRKAFANASTEERAEARRALGALLTMQFAATGVMGSFAAKPIGALIEGIVHMFADDDDWDYETAMRQNTLELMRLITPNSWDGFARRTSLALNKGIFDGFTPISMHGRLSVSELWYREPYQEMEGANLFHHLLEQMVGPIGGIAKNYMIAPTKFAEGEWQRGFEYMMPKFAKDLAISARYATENALTGSGNLILDTGGTDSIVKAMGFAPAKLSDRYDENSAKRRLQTQIQKSRSRLVRQTVTADIEGDRSDQQAMRKKLADFNKRYDDYQITDKTLKRSKSSRLNANEKTQSGFRANNKLAGRLAEIDYAR